MFRIQSQMLPASFNAIRRELDEAFRNSQSSERCEVEQPVRIPTSLWEDESGFTAEFELPGFVRDEIELHVEAGKLSIEAKRTPPEHQGQCRHCDRSVNHAVRQFDLPESVDGQNAAAELQNGVLTVHLPKRPESQPHRVHIGLPKPKAAPVTEGEVVVGDATKS